MDTIERKGENVVGNPGEQEESINKETRKAPIEIIDRIRKTS
jgi:hypothetical protein